ncbi:Fc.00g083800.m01.CDS01 [Cosmosporella sp. VM-42]
MDLDEFSDDSLDDLPDNALQELENNAIQFTQAQAQAQVQQNPPSQAQPEYIWVEDDDLDTTEVTNDVGIPVGRPVVDNTLQQQKQQQEKQQQQQLQQDARRSLPPVPNPRWNPTVDPSKRPPPGLAARTRPPSVGPPNQPVFGSQRFQSQTPGFSRAQPSQFARPALPQNRFAPSQSSQGPPGDIVSALQIRLRALETELAAARGEVSIIRSNSTKAQQQHDAEVSRLKKLNAEQLAKQERILEAAVVAENNANTELRFLQQDMREVNDRARKKDHGAGVGTTTPKKAAKTWRVADGFDEMDIVVSPSKGQGRSKNAGSVAVNVGERTPSKGKRKRQVVDSPIMALETHTDDAIFNDAQPEPTPAQAGVVVAAPAPPLFEFLPFVLDHGCFDEQPPTFDTFARFAFPSDPNTSLAALIYQTLPLMGRPEYPMQLPVDIAEFMVSLWIRCCEEKYWEPIKYLVDLISFTFQLQATDVAPYLIGTLIPIASTTISSLAEWRHRLLDADLPKHTEYQLLNEHIDTTNILSLLYTTAITCTTTLDETESGSELRVNQVWRLISLDFVSHLLTPKQRLSDVLGMLELLTTSSLPGSIGPITDEKDPIFVAQLIIDKVVTKLTDFPRAATTPAQKRIVRLAALRTLIAFARYPFGAIQLASSSTALPRLVTCLSACIDDLYNQPIPPFILPSIPNDDDESSTEPESPSAVLCRIISQCVVLIHTLVTGPHTANIADISQKLSMFHGGSQRYLIALGRLTFAEEDLVMEAGIDGETVDAAHELLEMAVTPDEGEIVSEAFGA